MSQNRRRKSTTYLRAILRAQSWLVLGRIFWALLILDLEVSIKWVKPSDLSRTDKLTTTQSILSSIRRCIWPRKPNM